MKVSKTEVIDLFQKVNLKGVIEECVIEEDGTITVSSNDEIVAVGQTTLKFSDKRLAFQNLSLLIKIVNSLETADNVVNIEVKDGSMIIAAKSGKYTYKLADAATIESMPTFREKIKEYETTSPIKLSLPLLTVTNLKKAIGTFGSKENTAMTLMVTEGKLNAVVIDEATKNKAVIEMGDCTGDFVLTYNADMVARILDMVIGEECEICLTPPTDKNVPLSIVLKDKGFSYYLSPRQVASEG